MEFQRIGKNTVQCHMSVEEMQEYGFAIEDFFTDQEKSREFLEQLVERAEEEVGYEVESGMVSMQLMKMPDESLVITFSDRSEEGIQGMMEQLHNLTEMIGEDGELTSEDMENLDAVKKEIAAAREKAGDMMDIIPDAGQEKANKKGASKDTIKEGYAKHAQEMEKKYIEKQKKEQSAARIFRFSSLSMVESFAQSLSLEKTIPSKLYQEEDTGMWYLMVKKGKLKLEEYIDVCEHLGEYGVLCSKQPYVDQYCKEHYRCIIPKHALKKIKEYV